MSFTAGIIVGAVVGGTWRLLTNKYNGEENQRRLKQYFSQASEHSRQVNQDASKLANALHQLHTQGIPSLNRAILDINQSIQHFNESSQPKIRRIIRSIDSLQQQADELTKDEKKSQKN